MATEFQNGHGVSDTSNLSRAKMVSFFTFESYNFNMTGTTFSSFLAEIAHDRIFVIDASIEKAHYMTIDLSETNTDLIQVDMSSAVACQNFISGRLNTNNKQVAYGGYLEKRSLYSRSDYFNTHLVRYLIILPTLVN